MNPVIVKIIAFVMAGLCIIAGAFVKDETAKGMLFTLAGSLMGWAGLKRPGDKSDDNGDGIGTGGATIGAALILAMVATGCASAHPVFLRAGKVVFNCAAVDAPIELLDDVHADLVSDGWAEAIDRNIRDYGEAVVACLMREIFQVAGHAPPGDRVGDITKERYNLIAEGLHWEFSE